MITKDEDWTLNKLFFKSDLKTKGHNTVDVFTKALPEMKNPVRTKTCINVVSMNGAQLVE